jgi:hypothetical protein
MAKAIDAVESFGGGRMAGGGRAEAFRQAYRHSRRVRQLRVVVPIAAVGIFGLVVFVSWWDPLKSLNLPISMGSLSMSGSRVTMEAPRRTDGPGRGDDLERPAGPDRPRAGRHPRRHHHFREAG